MVLLLTKMHVAYPLGFIIIKMFDTKLNVVFSYLGQVQHVLNLYRV